MQSGSSEVPTWLLAASWAGAAMVTAVGVWFARRQNRGARMGGAISRAKQVWLVWAVYVWFVLTPLLAIAPVFPASVRAVLGAFAAFMGLRGVVELFMLFVTKNWRPPLGIAHDVACVVLLLGGSAWLVATGLPTGGLAAWGAAYVGVLTVSLGLETWYALAFHRAVEGRTTGEDGVWFAAAGEARFSRINRVTTFANVPLVLFVLALLVALSLPARAGAEPSAWAAPDQVQLDLRHNQRPLTMPTDVFDIFFDGGLTAFSRDWIAASLSAGARYGVDDNLELGLRLLRVTMSEAPDTGIARPTLFAAYRVGAGPFEAALRLESEAPTSAGALQLWLQVPMLLRMGPYLRADLSPEVSAITESAWRWGAGVPLRISGQITDRLRVFGTAELLLPDLRRGRDVLMRAGGGLAFAFGKPNYEVVAQVRSPTVALAGERPPDPSLGNYVEGVVQLRLFFQGFADDPEEPVF